MDINKIVSSASRISGKCYTSKLDIDSSVMLTTWLWAQIRSKDPNTKVGASIYDYDSGSLFLGYNGFPPKFKDEVRVWNNRDINSKDSKYIYVVHAEQNLFMKAINKYNPKTSKMFITHYPCHNCVKNVILPSRIKKIFYMDKYPYDPVSHKLLKKFHITIDEINLHP